MLNSIGCDIYILSSSDEFLNEFVPERNKRLRWLTDFTGSYGIAFISKEKKIFFTDGRYMLQAKKELKNNFEIIDQSKLSLNDYITENVKKKKILLDTRLFSRDLVNKLINSSKLNQNKIIHDKDLILDKLWKDRLSSQINKVYELKLRFSGLSRKKKIKSFLKFYCHHDAVILSSPESICWLLNLRGNGLEFTPIILCRIIVIKSTIFLFVEKNLVEKLSFLKSSNFNVHSLEKFPDFIKKIKKNVKIFIDKNLSYFFYRLLISKKIDLDTSKDFCMLNKSIKNKNEIEISRNSHVNDGIALVKFFSWLEDNCVKNKITEYQASEKLDYLRSRNKNFVSKSFPTIAASDENGAIIHYSPKKKSKILRNGSIFLCDSGAQYYGSTTDVTRTILVGDAKPSDTLKLIYTEVLMGHIDISKLKFPKGTKGSQIDILGRYYLWKRGLDYNHGTGHGVGSFLSVHESPPNISKNSNNFELKPGMILSNEPGCYLKNKFGVRIENLLLVKEEKNSSFLEFETLTHCPYQKNLIDEKKLNNDQISWINKYHKKIWETLKDHLNRSEAEWLKKNVSKI